MVSTYSLDISLDLVEELLLMEVQIQDIFASHHLGATSTFVSIARWWLHGSLLAGSQLHHRLLRLLLQQRHFCEHFHPKYFRCSICESISMNLAIILVASANVMCSPSLLTTCTLPLEFHGRHLS